MTRFTINKIYSYFSVLGIIGSAVGIIILASIRYAQVSFELKDLKDSQSEIYLKLEKIQEISTRNSIDIEKIRQKYLFGKINVGSAETKPSIYSYYDNDEDKG